MFAHKGNQEYFKHLREVKWPPQDKSCCKPRLRTIVWKVFNFISYIVLLQFQRLSNNVGKVSALNSLSMLAKVRNSEYESLVWQKKVTSPEAWKLMWKHEKARWSQTQTCSPRSWTMKQWKITAVTNKLKDVHLEIESWNNERSQL